MLAIFQNVMNHEQNRALNVAFGQNIESDSQNVPFIPKRTLQMFLKYLVFLHIKFSFFTLNRIKYVDQLRKKEALP